MGHATSTGRNAVRGIPITCKSARQGTDCRSKKTSRGSKVEEEAAEDVHVHQVCLKYMVHTKRERQGGEDGGGERDAYISDTDSSDSHMYRVCMMYVRVHTTHASSHC